MNKGKKTVLTVILILAGIFVAFAGYRVITKLINITSFTAEIAAIQDNVIRVDGLEEDIYYGGVFLVRINEDTRLISGKTKISIDDLEVGDVVRITFDGFVRETGHAQIPNTYKIELIEKRDN